MAFPTDCWKIQYTFDLGGDGEVAVTGFHARWSGGGLSMDEQAATLAGRAAAAWKAGFDGHTSWFGSGVVLAKTAAYHVIEGPGPSDHWSSGPVASDETWSGSGADSLPWECSLVITTEAIPAGTNVPNARRRRGRIYLPPMSPTVLAGVNGFILNTAQPTIMAAALAWLEAWNDEVSGAQTRVVVLSRRGAMQTDVDHVSMDSQLDLQKRRQNRQSIPTRLVSDPLDA